MVFDRVFVTVGTTQFNKLISHVLHDDVLDILAARGCRTLTLQVGQGKIVPNAEKNGIQIHSFSLKSSISEEISEADLIISHAGAGSCLDVLNSRKPLVVVINEDLMDNHQEELASKLEEEGYVFKTNCSNLTNVLHSMDVHLLKPFIPGNPKIYANYIDCVMGFSC